tara:strand:+ start:221 stop:1099 length:879 start_codon:yes stop_codon:yes gene_type:complete
MFFLTIYYKKETFTQCQELVELNSQGVCIPYYGIPLSAAINPYHKENDKRYNLETDSTNRKNKNKEAARILCNNTPGCSGIAQNDTTDGPYEAYLCKKEWNGQDVEDITEYPLKTYKCNNKTFTNKSLTQDDDIILPKHKNIGDFNKSFNQYNYNRHDERKFPNGNLINIQETTIPIKFNVECSTNNIPHFISTNLKKYIDFANTMDSCVGFHIKKKDNGYEVYFAQKKNAEQLELESNPEYESYSIIISDNGRCPECNPIKKYDVWTNKNCKKCPGETRSYCTETADRVCA